MFTFFSFNAVKSPCCLTACIFWDISCDTTIYINIFLVYLLIQELLVDKTCFFAFLPVSDKAIMNQLNIITATCIASLSEPFHTCLWPTRKGEYLRLTNAIKHTEMSYLIASLASHRFLCVSYQNVLERGTSKLRNYNKLQKYQPFRFNSLPQNFRFGIFVCRVPFCL